MNTKNMINMTKKNLYTNSTMKLKNYLNEDVTDRGIIRGMFECMAIGSIIGTIIGILLFGY